MRTSGATETRAAAAVTFPVASRYCVVTRPDEFTVVRTSVTAPPRCSVRPSFAPVNGNGPQLWYGEMVSYGSGTETRYGTAVPQTSSDDAVRPPDVEKKNVFATAPS